MKTMEGILKQELIRLKETEKSYVREIAKLPLGSVQEKTIKERDYPYLVSSKKSKVRYQYLGNLSEEKLKKLQEGITLRKKYQSLLKEVRRDIKRIAKILYGKSTV